MIGRVYLEEKNEKKDFVWLVVNNIQPRASLISSK
jgi:hypothetical protein